MSFARTSFLQRQSHENPWKTQADEESPEEVAPPDAQPIPDEARRLSEAARAKKKRKSGQAETAPLIPERPEDTGILSRLKQVWASYGDVISLLVFGLWLAIAFVHKKDNIFHVSESRTEFYVLFMLIVAILGCIFSVTARHIPAPFEVLNALAEPVTPSPFVKACILPGIAALLLPCMIVKNIAGNGPELLQSLLGVLLIPLMIFCTSAARDQVAWRTVLCGISLEVIFAVIAMNVTTGQELLAALGDLVSKFLDFSVAGSGMLFGRLATDPSLGAIFAFKILPTIIFFSSFVSVMYFLGALQVAIMGVASVLKALLGATTTEAVSCAGNIFLGLTEVPLLLKPLLPQTTSSEQHVIMVCGYASVAGSVLAGYIGMGIKSDYLICSCFMAAPTSIALSKLSFPETERGDGGVEETSEEDTKEALQSPDGSLVEAAGNGAANAIALVANIAAMLVAFTGLITALNTVSGWGFECLGLEDGFNFSVLMSYVLAPVAMILGVPHTECLTVGLLLAKKMVLNEFLAYSDLGILVHNRSIPLAEHVKIPGLKATDISPRAEVIATFALCGFANLGSIGITLGGLSTVCPEKREAFAKIVVRAMFIGFSVSLLNASMAGLLMSV